MAYTTIDDPTIHFNTKLYTGTGSSNAVTGVGFQPDWVWIKNRSTTGNHALFDVINGVTKYVNSNTNYGLQTSAPTVTSFDSDGFTVGSSADLNGSGNSIASWNWLAGGSASSNSNGSITSSVSANTTAGFSIVRFSGTGSLGTVGHGLGAVPDVLFFKRLDTTGAWASYHKPLGATKYMRLDSTSAQITASDEFNDTEPTSTVFTVATDGGVNASGTDNMLVYCMTEIKGYSKFGSYTGNGDVDGTFVYTGFRPAWVMTKESSGTGHWRIRDNKRFDQANPIDKVLYANASTTETDEDNTDFLSNGFKLRTTGGENNGSGDTYIYLAFAESPFVNSSGIPCNAR